MSKTQKSKPGKLFQPGADLRNKVLNERNLRGVNLTGAKLNELFKEWYGDGEAVTKLSPKDRRNSFIEFVRNHLNNEEYFRLVEKSIIDYANNDLNAMFGGRRRRNKRSVKTHFLKIEIFFCNC
jgi:uncharacterized protein YjbI with pentapeptide repeats